MLTDWRVLLAMSLSFSGVCAVAYSMWLYLRAKRHREEDQLRKRLGLLRVEDLQSVINSSLIRENEEDEAFVFLGGLGESIEETIASAGRDMTVRDFVSQTAVLFLIGAMVGVYLSGGVQGILLGLLPAPVPRFILQRAAERRSKAMLEQLPDALEVMTRAMQAGAGLSDCFKLAASELPDPISTEFTRVYEEVRLGMDWNVSLAQLVTRNPLVFDLRIFVSSLLLQRETGGNLIELLTKMSGIIRKRSVFDSKVLAMTAEARTSGMVLAGMPLAVALLVFVVEPSYLAPFVDYTMGRYMAIGAVLTYCFGLMVMRDIAKVEL